MKDGNVQHAIIVYTEKLTPYANQAVSKAQAKGHFRLETFKESELLVNITHHVLVRARPRR